MILITGSTGNAGGAVASDDGPAHAAAFGEPGAGP
jgi:hypothetical protein